MITAITPTGDRPLAFTLCRQWMKNQTRRPDQWVIIDDGMTPMTLDEAFSIDNFSKYIRREPQPDDPKHTLDLNLKTALPLIAGDKIIIIEDDDYYAPTYIEEMSHRLSSHKFVGIIQSKYYHLFSGGYIVHGNKEHASLAQTAFRSSFLPEFRAALNEPHEYTDMKMWEKSRGPQYTANDSLLFVDTETSLYCGIKGLPGRKGIVGHNGNESYYKYDNSNRDILKQWVPLDYQVYLDIIGKQE